MLEYFISKKHILERKKQSIISIVGIMIGILVLTVSIGISNGLNKNMINSVLSISSHVLINEQNPIIDYKKVIQDIEKIEGVKGAVASVPFQGLLKYKNEYNAENIVGMKIQGFDFKSAIKAMDLNKKIIAGEISENRDSILIGSEYALNTGIGLGEVVTLISPDGKEIKFKVSGVFKTGYYDYDNSVAMINLESAQYITYSTNSINEINITLDNPYNADKIANKISNEYGLRNRTWGELNKNLLTALSLEKSVMIILFSLIVVIAGFVVWVTLNMLVKEKIKDIGIMRAMGFSKTNIMRIFLFQGLILGSIGIILGILISLAILWYIKNYSIPGISSIYYIKAIPIEISIKEILMISGANFVVILCSSIFPAYLAAGLETQEALKYE